MRDFRSLLGDWKDRLRTRGHSSELIWLPCEAMILRWVNGRDTGRVYIRPPVPHLTETQVENALALIPDTEPGVFMLVGSAGGCSYVTLLMDPFGSDEDVFLEQANFYFHADPYAHEVLFVASRVQWLWLTVCQRLSPKLSSLDYAFTVQQTREA